ncbi:hypothetical protein [Rubidibacter lacunae]|uniref:hypothetical protein n=1 Tax=Rubidibacter lacunae TaxID=582514 RepID=UPI00040E40B0|nr:hypothetical protein [Rubidibacter lacunae]
MANVRRYPDAGTFCQIVDGGDRDVLCLEVPLDAANDGLGGKSTASSVEPRFVNRCGQKFAEYLGAIAPILSKSVVDEHPALSPPDVQEGLSQCIGDPRHAAEFKQCMQH